MRGARADAFLADYPNATELRFTQDPATAALVIENLRGVPSDDFFNAISLTAGSYPSGWFFGIDIPYSELLTQAFSPHPIFRNVFDSQGSARTSISAPLPSGLTLFAVSLDIGPFGNIVSVTAPLSYTLP